MNGRGNNDIYVPFYGVYDIKILRVEIFNNPALSASAILLKSNNLRMPNITIQPNCINGVANDNVNNLIFKTNGILFNHRYYLFSNSSLIYASHYKPIILENNYIPNSINLYFVGSGSGVTAPYNYDTFGALGVNSKLLITLDFIEKKYSNTII
jgi:hypothetical protein